MTGLPPGPEQQPSSHRRANGRQLVDLSGSWRVHTLSPQMLKTGADPELDDSPDSGWTTLQVPGHWANNDVFADSDGPLLYRRHFSIAPADDAQHGDPETRYWLRFDGIMSEGEIWMDGQYLGATVAYFAAHQFDVTALLAERGDHVAERSDHVIAVDVRCSPPDSVRTMATATDDGPRDKTALTGTLQVGPLAPRPNPGGIWQPVAIDTTGPVAIAHSRLLCTGASREQATISIRAVLDAAEAINGQLRATVSPLDNEGRGLPGRTEVFVRPQPLARGENRIEWSITIDEPRLWWPLSLGDQHLYEVVLSVDSLDGAHPETLDGAHTETLDGAHTVSDEVAWTTGLRSVSMEEMIWTVNGRRLFLKAVAYGPANPFPGSLTTDDVEADIEAAAQGGFNAIRVAGHLARPEVLHAADRAGMLVWQDLPLVGGYSSKTQRAVKTLIREAVDVVAHHPSVIVWGGHCQPNGEAIARPNGDSVTHPARQIARHVLPSWNRSFLDSIVGRELEAADPTRPIVARSGHLPSRLDQPSDSRLWLGWRTGKAGDAASLFDRWPRLATFPAGIGAQSLTLPAAVEQQDWSTAEFESLVRYVNPSHYDDFASWAEATDQYQAELLRRHVETIRRRKFQPSGGFCVTALADAEPWGGFGLVRFDRSPKPALAAMSVANQLVLPIIVDPPSAVASDSRVTVGVEVLSDLFYGLDGIMLRAAVNANDGTILAFEQWQLDVDADGPTNVGSVSFQAPGGGQVEMVLTMIEGGSTVVNGYSIPVETTKRVSR